MSFLLMFKLVLLLLTDKLKVRDRNLENDSSKEHGPVSTERVRLSKVLCT